MRKCLNSRVRHVSHHINKHTRARAHTHTHRATRFDSILDVPDDDLTVETARCQEGFRAERGSCDFIAVCIVQAPRWVRLNLGGTGLE